MVARMVRDHKVVGSNPVASTINKGVAFATPLFISWLGTMGFEGREVGGSTADKTVWWTVFRARRSRRKSRRHFVAVKFRKSAPSARLFITIAVPLINQ